VDAYEKNARPKFVREEKMAVEDKAHPKLVWDYSTPTPETRSKQGTDKRPTFYPEHSPRPTTPKPKPKKQQPRKQSIMELRFKALLLPPIVATPRAKSVPRKRGGSVPPTSRKPAAHGRSVSVSSSIEPLAKSPRADAIAVEAALAGDAVVAARMAMQAAEEAEEARRQVEAAAREEQDAQEEADREAKEKAKAEAREGAEEAARLADERAETEAKEKAEAEARAEAKVEAEVAVKEEAAAEAEEEAGKEVDKEAKAEAKVEAEVEAKEVLVAVQKQLYASAMQKKDLFKGRKQMLELASKAKEVTLAKEDVDQAMVASVLKFLSTNGHMFSSSNHEITGADLSTFVVMCKGEHAALDVLQRLDHGGNVFDTWEDLVNRAQEVLDGGHQVKVTAEDRVDICNFLTRAEIDLITELEEARLDDYVTGLPASAGALTDEEVTEALNEILQAGAGVVSTKRVLAMMINSGLINLPLWDLVHEVHLASRFLPHPATEAADVDRVVEFLQDSPLMSADFELEYGDLVLLLHKTLGIEGCLNRLHLLERKGKQFYSYAEMEAGVEPLQLPTKSTRERLSKHLEAMQLKRPEMELDELLLVGGSVDEVVVHLKEMADRDQLPKSGYLLGVALGELLNAERKVMRAKTLMALAADSETALMKTKTFIGLRTFIGAPLGAAAAGEAEAEAAEPAAPEEPTAAEPTAEPAAPAALAEPVF
jgi:hypothetical protein